MTASTALSAPTTTKKIRKRRISPKIVEAIRLLASGEVRTQKQAAERVGVTETWLSTMLGREETRVLLDQTCRKYIRSGKVRATARLIELLDSSSQRTALEASKHVLGIEGIAPPRDGTTVNISNGGSGYIIQIGNRDAEVFEGEISDVGGVLIGRRMTDEERRNGVQTTPGRGPMIDVTPESPEDEQ